MFQYCQCSKPKTELQFNCALSVLMCCDVKALIHSVNPPSPEVEIKISVIARTDVKAVLQQVENALE